MSVIGVENRVSVSNTVAGEVVYTRAEVLRHNTIDDCWIIVHNHVHDITPFVRHHPGGKEILMARAGEDATSFFAVKHGVDKAVVKRLKKFRIGVLAEEEQIKTNDLEDPFLLELLERCYKENLFSVPSGLKNPYVWMRALNITAFFTLSMLALYGGFPFWAAIIMVVVQAVIGTSSFGLIAHEATHRNFPKNKVLKFLMDMSWPVFWPFIQQDPLRYEHNSHHIKIGDPEYDFEVAGFASVIRYSGLVLPKKLHRFQFKLAKYIYPFYANIITTFGGARASFWSTHNRKVVKEHTIGIIATSLYFVLIPTIFRGNFFWYIFLYLVYQCVLFYGIYVGSAINHFIPEVARPIPEDKKDNYVYYNCHNTSNFCLDSRFWFWYTGGFNTQIEHHLIPFIPVENLRKMIPILKDLCTKYDYPYHEFHSVKTLWDAHYDYLRIMSGQQDSEAVEAEIKVKKAYRAR